MIIQPFKMNTIPFSIETVLVQDENVINSMSTPSHISNDVTFYLLLPYKLIYKNAPKVHLALLGLYDPSALSSEIACHLGCGALTMLGSIIPLLKYCFVVLFAMQVFLT